VTTAEIEHPVRCDLRECSAAPGTTLSRSWHRSAEITAPGRLRATGRLTKIDRSNDTATLVSVSVDSPLHGVSEVEVSAAEAHDLGRFLIVLAAQARDEQP
jgi:hypothetical protein